MRFHAKNIFFKCVLIFLVLEDEVGARKKLDKYRDDDPSLNNSLEAKFLDALLKALSE